VHDTEARRFGRRLGFSVNDLRIAAVRALQSRCEYCLESFSVETFGVVRRNPLHKRLGNEVGVRSVDFSLPAYAVCCLTCARAKRRLPEHAWRGVLAALARDEPDIARDFLLRAGGGVGTPPPPRRRG
jgi:hypothetical protein